MRPLTPIIPFALFAAACGGPAETTPAATSDFEVALTPIVEEAEWPWGMAFLPNGDLLFTEKEGGLKFVAGGEGAASAVSGLPDAYIEGQLSDDASALENVEEIFWADARDTAYHYGSRLQFANDGTLFVSLGEGFKYMKDSQDPTNTHGKIVRINADGSIPADNPFADGESGKPSVWSYGHRNVQGLYYDPETGTLYETEHGPKGGDELNIVTPGTNYGWPEITYGVNYDGTIITNETEAEGMAQPMTYWVPSIAPSGLVMLTSDVYPGWKGDLFTGGMNGPAGLELTRIDMENGEVVGRESLFDGEYAIRDVVQGPDGHLYVATKDFDGIFRVDLVEAE